jgi:sugar lactone lactonase YvrE
MRRLISIATSGITVVLGAAAMSTTPASSSEVESRNSPATESVTTRAVIANPQALAVDAADGLYVVVPSSHRVYRVAEHGSFDVLAGAGALGFAGDGALGGSASLNSPSGVAVDRAGNVYIADSGNNRIRKVGESGVITTIGGTGTPGFSGDDGLVSAAQLNYPSAVASDSAGTLYVVDAGNQRIRRIDPRGIITTIAGTGTPGFSGDGGDASKAQLSGPTGVAVDNKDSVYIADRGNHRIRKVDSSGIITTYAGTSTAGFAGDGGNATAAQLNYPFGVATDAVGNVYIADSANQRVRKVTRSGIITTIAGDGTAGNGRDGGDARRAQLHHPVGVAVDSAGNVYIVDSMNSRIAKVSTAGILSTVVGDGADLDIPGGDPSARQDGEAVMRPEP